MKPKNNKAFEMAFGWIIGMVIVLVVLVVIFAFWQILYKAVQGLPG